MENDQFYRELPIWMQSMIQWMDHQMNLSTTTKRKASMGQKGGRHSPLEVEWTHLVCESTHA
jgi:hypothetical protein